MISTSSLVLNHHPLKPACQQAIRQYAQQLHSGAVAFRPLRDATLNADLHMTSRTDNENPVLPAFGQLLSREFEHSRA